VYVVKKLFSPEAYQKAYDCIVNPKLQNVFFMGSALEQYRFNF